MALYRGHLQKAGRSLPSLFYTSLQLLLKQTPAPSHSLQRLPVLQGGERSAGLPATSAHLKQDHAALQSNFPDASLECYDSGTTQAPGAHPSHACLHKHRQIKHQQGTVGDVVKRQCWVLG